MRIVAVQTGLSPVSVLGGEITDREFLVRLAERGIEIHVLAEEGQRLVEHRNFVPHFYRRYLWKKIPYSANFNVAIELRRLLRRLGRVEWIRFNSPQVVGIGTLVSRGGNRVWASYLHCEDWPFWKFVDSWLPRFCDLVTCLSEDTRADVVERCPSSDRGSTVVVPMGIDARRFDPSGPDRRAIRASLGVQPDDVLVTFAGVLRARKGVRDLIATWERLPSRGRARLLIIGKPVGEPETELVQALVQSDPRVVHLAEVDYEQMPGYFCASDVFFFPTYLEGFGIVVAEAMAAGLPVLTTRAKGVRTVVREGETALLADVGAVDQMVAHLERLVVDAPLRARLGAAGRERVLTEFDWERIIDRLVGLLEGTRT